METLNLCDIYNACGINRLYPQNRANCSRCISRLRRSVQQNTFCRLHRTPPGKQWLLYPNAQQRSCPGSAQEILFFSLANDHNFGVFVRHWVWSHISVFCWGNKRCKNYQDLYQQLSAWVIGVRNGWRWDVVSIVSLYPLHVAIDTCQ